MKNLSTLSLIFLLLFACNTPPETSDTADMVIFGGTIYTMDEAIPVVEAVAVKGGKIVFAGFEEPAKALVDSNTQVIDLQGKAMTPGFIESHAHMMGIGQLKRQLDLSDIKNYREMVARVAAAVKKAKPGEWILGRGWHQSKWDELPEKVVKGFQSHEALSAVSPDNPVYLRHASGHAGFANAKAMEIAGISADTDYDGRGEVFRDENGQPTGIFNEGAASLIARHIPEGSLEVRQEILDLGMQECLKNGITSFCDAGESAKTIELYQSYQAQEKLDMRLWVMLSGHDSVLLEKWYQKGPQIDDWLTIRAIKLYSDGALGSRGAWLLAPYTDAPDISGEPSQPMAHIGEVCHQALTYGFQVCVHAIGDRANREVLDQFQKAFEAQPEKAKDHRFRIEHAQHLSREDIGRFAELGVIASMQGIHMASDRPWAIHRLGIDRIKEGAYVWQKLLQSGAKVINGTDAPVEPVNPINCYYASVTRRPLDGSAEEGYEVDQRMSRMEALRSYTLDAAFGAFDEPKMGSIQVGKFADFTVFSQDLIKVPVNEILETRVDMTIVGGEVKFQRDKNM